LLEIVLFEVIEDPTDVAIHASDAAKVVFHVLLVFPTDEIFTFEVELFKLGVALCPLGGFGVFGIHFEVIAEAHGAVDFHGLLVSWGASARIIVEQAVGLGDGDIFEFIHVLGVGNPRAVGRLVVNHEHERFGFIPFEVEPFERFIRDDIRDVSFNSDFSILLAVLGVGGFIDEKGWVRVAPLSWEDLPEIKTLHVAVEVDFSNHRGLVAIFTENFWKGLLALVKGVGASISNFSVEVGKFARQ